MPPGNHAWEPAVAPHNAYPCRGEDRWLALAVMNDAEWQALVRAMDEPAWARMTVSQRTNAASPTRRRSISTSPHGPRRTTTYELMDLLQAAGVRAAACQHASDRFDRDPQLAARDWWQHLPHPEIGDCEYDGVAPKLSASPGALRSASPLLGENTTRCCLACSV